MTRLTPQTASEIDVLVVDDQLTQQEYFRRILGPEGFRVSAVRSGEQAMAWVQRLRPHVILMDLNMPGLSGIETAERLRADPKSADIPILMVTVRGDEEAMERSFLGGCNDYLLKPVGRDELLEKLADVLGLETSASEPLS